MTLVDSLFDGGDPDKRPDYMKAVRSVWLIGSDEVIKSITDLHRSIKDPLETAETNLLYSQMVKAMRKDIHRRSYLPPKKTRLGAEYFPVESSKKYIREDNGNREQR